MSLSESYNPLFAAFAIAVFVSIIGAFFGSLCAKLVYRLGGRRFRGFQVFSPSFCPNCAKPIALADKLPIIGYIRTRGHCRRCGEAISPRYLIFEVAGFCLPVILFYFENYSIKALYDYFVIMIMLTGAYISYDTEIFPPVLSSCVLIAAVIANLTRVIRPQESLYGLALALILICALFYTLSSRKTLKQYAYLAAAVGAYLGWQQVLIVFGLYLILLGLDKVYQRLEMARPLASGTLFSSAVIVVCIFGEPLQRLLESVLRFLTSK